MNNAVKQKLKKHLIKQPWITERAASLSPLRKYIFVVDWKANKPEVKKAIESIYGVKVAEVNVINIKGKIRRFGKSIGRIPGKKKAVVTLKKGHKIEVMPT